jgi:predicted acyl esterase
MPARTTLTVALLSLLLGTTSAHADVRRLTFQVPVNTPDETGAKVVLDTDVYLPDGAAPAGGFPLIEVFHGGGADKNDGFDAGHARFFAEHGYVSLIYSQRGHGSSGGLTAVAGPNEMHDLYDVTRWALHQPFGIDSRRIALTGYSQGGLNTNLAQVWGSDPSINPDGIHFTVLEPGNTPDYVADALVPNGVVKLSFGAGLIATYGGGAHAHVSPLFGKWFGTVGGDALYAQGTNRCDTTAHDTLTGTTLADLAFRSVGCFADRVTPPVLWAQSFDDGLFPADMAVEMWRRLPDQADNRLYLGMGGHAAPAADAGVEQDRLAEQLAFFDHFMKGTPLDLPRVTYWTRDPAVKVPADAYEYPPRAWTRQTASDWPPAGVADTPFGLGADGALVESGAKAGALPLAGTQADPGSDTVAQSVFAPTPLGASPLPPAPTGTSDPGVVAGFATAPLAADRELSGHAALRVAWTPDAQETQVVAKLYDRAPDGTLTFFARGVQGVRGAVPGQQKTLTFATNDFSVLVHAGHRVLLTVTAGDASFYKAYAGSSQGGTLTAGPGSTITLPLRTTPAASAPARRTAQHKRHKHKRRHHRHHKRHRHRRHRAHHRSHARTS